MFAVNYGSSNLQHPAQVARRIDEDDATSNPLFTALRANADLWGIVTCAHGPRPCVALPRPSTLLAIDRGVIATHILQPTEDRRQFRTLDGKTILAEVGKFKTGTGFDFPRTVDILFDEDYYTGDDHKVKLYLISRPLAGGKEPPPPPPSLQTLDECTQFLGNLPQLPNKDALRGLHAKVEEFKQSTKLEMGFEKAAFQTLSGYARDAVAAMLQVPLIAARCRHLPWLVSAIQHAVFCTVAAKTYDRIFAAIRSFNVLNDQAVLRFCSKHSSDSAALGVRHVLVCDVSDAVMSLWKAVHAKTPTEKLHYLSLCMHLATKSASDAARNAQIAREGTVAASHHHQVSKRDTGVNSGEVAEAKLATEANSDDGATNEDFADEIAAKLAAAFTSDAPSSPAMRSAKSSGSGGSGRNAAVFATAPANAAERVHEHDIAALRRPLSVSVISFDPLGAVQTELIVDTAAQPAAIPTADLSVESTGTEQILQPELDITRPSSEQVTAPALTADTATSANSEADGNDDLALTELVRQRSNTNTNLDDTSLIVSGDDMIPLALWVLVHARLPSAVSMVTYLEQLGGEPLPQAAYHLSVFSAAVQHALSQAPDRTMKET